MINQGRVRTIPPRVYVLVLISVLLVCSSPSGGVVLGITVLVG